VGTGFVLVKRPLPTPGQQRQVALLYTASIYELMRLSENPTTDQLRHFQSAGAGGALTSWLADNGFDLVDLELGWKTIKGKKVPSARLNPKPDPIVPGQDGAHRMAATKSINR
jgi:hypothetical protein